ncbi:MAG: hypothetical protein DLM67_09670 [Candidatus Nephthysia bennettiae]|uniref:Uncharacterized protein n=1 Tax=Candidatus Nephthysia bennettiae TaxID=3127016 RepID=A0A934JVI1_9BACT|nr:hypothetical protein [Candidatus Dormibacteraeota bacterium]PZR96306.1 MAG: hypothetical protein DLM67_09670 [Candidatus Dormibacteraeota bacterium]
MQIDPRGRFLLVIEKGTNLIDVYGIASDGSLNGPTSFPSVGAVPFGMAFRPGKRSEFVVADAQAAPTVPAP